MDVSLFLTNGEILSSSLLRLVGLESIFYHTVTARKKTKAYMDSSLEFHKFY